MYRTAVLQRSAVLCGLTLLALIAISKSYSAGSAAIVIFSITAMAAVMFFLARLSDSARELVEPLSIMTFAFAPPALVFGDPISVFGVNLLPAYVIVMLSVCFRGLRNAYSAPPKRVVIWCVLLAGMIIVELLRINVAAFHSNVVILVAKSSALIMCYALAFIFVLIPWMKSIRPEHALTLLILIFALQFLQLATFALYGLDGHFLWFRDESHWLRFGGGYEGSLLNPIRAYAIVWDPNYLIALTLPLFVIAGRASRRRTRWFTNTVFVLSVIMTLSYQSFIIMFVALTLISARAIWTYIARLISIVLAMLLPVLCALFYLIVPVTRLPDAQLSSWDGRLHILWGVGHAIVSFPLGIGFGAFRPMSVVTFFEYSVSRPFPPHGWLFEVMVAGGLIGYYMLVSILFYATRDIGKRGNIILLGFIFWGTTSPAIATPYFWIFLAGVYAVRERIVTAEALGSLRRDCMSVVSGWQTSG